MKRIEFRLSMPSRGSWDGGWSGDKAHYVIIRSLSDDKARRILDEGGYNHRWDDGWTAAIHVRELPEGRQQKSDGFCGYDWMVDNIIQYGSPSGPTEAVT